MLSCFGNTSKLHVYDPENTENFTLKPLKGIEFGLHDLDLLETIGTGTFGRVRLVRSIEDKTYYALKIMKKSKIVHLKQLSHIMDEIRILSRIRCVFIVNLHAVFQDDNNLYLLLDFLSGGELFSHLRKNATLNDDIARFYTVEIACALDLLHSLFIVYRDIKPENILLDKLGHIRLVDFGFAKIVPDRTFTICGTTEYLAPEIIKGSGYGCAADWWALGVLLYEMLVGYPPFYGDNPFAVYSKILSGHVKYPRTLSSTVVPALKGFLNAKRTSRLGCKNGINSLKKVAFFKGIDWESAKNMLIVPPYVPAAGVEGETINFDYYAEEAVEEPCNLNLEEREQFNAIDNLLDRQIVIV